MFEGWERGEKRDGGGGGREGVGVEVKGKVKWKRKRGRIRKMVKIVKKGRMKKGESGERGGG